VTWQGRHRPALRDAGVYHRPVQPQLPGWIAVGGTPASVERAGRNGLPLYLAILGQPERFVADPTDGRHRRWHDPADCGSE
jgi:alkanesulfonate monooxygenase SsuD/methylene tetrahydromethanopterin reductase-like flavin-dependent oxidoreductase (luciferase family)